MILHKQAIELTQGALKDAGFISAQFGETSGTPRQQYAALEAALAQTADDYRKTAEELQAESAHLHELKLLSDCMAIRYERMEAMQCIASTKSTFYLRGWVPAPVVEKVQKKLYALSNVCEIEISDPLEDDPPPTLLANRPVIAPFEAVVSNYSMPAPYGLDPTFIMAPFFACFFGMMVSDAGYGLLMAVLIPIALILLKPKGGIAKIGWIIGIGGVFTFFWGAMFNTWFGGGLKPMLIDPLNQPLEMMGLCLGLGVVHLFTATGVAAYMNFKRGKPWDAVFDQFLWIALISGLPMLFLPATASVGKILAIGGAAGIILTGGRKSPTLLGK
ncbi:MAG: V-type ATPase 116kDa subunit family protein, partial [Clostridia bacterium]